MRLGGRDEENEIKNNNNMKIETPELRGRIINSSLHLEDEIDNLILRFMSYYGKASSHQEEVFEIIKNSFIIGKTFGKKVIFLKSIFKSKIYKDVYYPELIKFYEINGMTMINDTETYEKFLSTIANKLSKIVKIRNAVAHGKINYDMLMGIDEIKERQKDREFILNGEIFKITVKNEKDFNSDISRLIPLLKYAGMVIVSLNFDVESLK